MFSIACLNGNIDRRAFLRLQDRLEKAMDFDEDTITFYHICAACEKQIQRIGQKKGLDKRVLYRVKLTLMKVL